jgi:outer membrane protein W
MKRILVISALLIMVLAYSATAQNRTTVSYSMGLGTGDLGEYASNFSGRGFTIDYRKMVQPNIGVGIYTGWNVFYDERPYDTYTIDNRSLSGRQFRYANSFPIMIAADYYVKSGEDLVPFFGLGVGTLYTNRRTEMGVFQLEQDAWSLAVAPQVGFYYSVNQNNGISFSAKYNIGLAAGDFDSGQSYLSLNIGFIFLGR